MMMGVARIACAITIAVGVKSNDRELSGPDRERARYKTKPTTTGGKPKNALIRTTNNLRPRKGKMAIAAPMGRLTIVAIAVAAKLTLIESPTIARKSCNLVAVLQKRGIEHRPQNTTFATKPAPGSRVIQLH